jgi:hypothetical protein
MSINTEYEEKINDAIYTFENVKTVNQLQKLTLEFLKGKIISTNYHYGPLNKESKKIINELIKMNESGFITISSQPGEIIESRRQRGYVCGLIKKNKYDKFIKLMYEISSHIYIRHTHDDSLISSLSRIGTYPEWFWISEGDNNKYTHVINKTYPFEYFIHTDIYDELDEKYYEIEVIDLDWGRENYIHNKITGVLEMINIDSE